MRVFKKNVTLFIALSKFAKVRFVSAGFDEERIVVLPNMVAIPSTPANPSSGVYAGFVGRFSAEKGVHTLLGSG